MVKILLLLNGGMFLLELYFGNPLIRVLALWPWGSSAPWSPGLASHRFEIWQLVSYSFLHGGALHLFLNMYALWVFGSRMEKKWGSTTFSVYYFVCVIGAGLTQLLVADLQGNVYPTIGASGGVFGLLLAFGLSYPNEKLMLIFPPVILAAKWFILIYAAIELWAGVTGTVAGVAHFAHIGGMLFGLILILYWKKYPQKRG